MGLAICVLLSFLRPRRRSLAGPRIEHGLPRLLRIRHRPRPSTRLSSAAANTRPSHVRARGILRRGIAASGYPRTRDIAAGRCRSDHRVVRCTRRNPRFQAQKTEIPARQLDEHTLMCETSPSSCGEGPNASICTCCSLDPAMFSARRYPSPRQPRRLRTHRHPRRIQPRFLVELRPSGDSTGKPPSRTSTTPASATSPSSPFATSTRPPALSPQQFQRPRSLPHRRGRSQSQAAWHDRLLDQSLRRGSNRLHVAASSIPPVPLPPNSSPTTRPTSPPSPRSRSQQRRPLTMGRSSKPSPPTPPTTPPSPSVINAANSNFTGQIGYAANWDEYNNANLTSTVWNNASILPWHRRLLPSRYKHPGRRLNFSNPIPHSRTSSRATGPTSSTTRSSPSPRCARAAPECPSSSPRPA